MKTLLLSLAPGFRSGALILLLAAAASLAPVSAASADETSNLVRTSNGAEIECTTPDGRTELVTAETHRGSALVMNDETMSCDLQEGRTTFVIKLPSTSLLDRFTFVNENAAAAGDLKISVSNYQLAATSPKWVEVDGNITFSRKRLFNLSMVGVEARYLRLSFNVASGGRIGAVGVFGGQKIDHSAWIAAGDRQLALVAKTAPDSKNKKRKDGFNFAKAQAKARVVHVSSGSLSAAQEMIDNNRETGFRFSPTDRHPTVIVELAQNEELNRVSSLYKMPGGGRVDVFLLSDISKSATDINYQQPVASATDENGDGEAAVDFDPEGTRYVAIRFSPAAAIQGEGAGFEVTEINAYGNTPVGLVDALGAPDVYASNFSGAQFSGQGSQDLSSSLGTLAVPPSIPAVSP